MKRTVLRSADLSCPTCVAKIEKGLRKVAGVQSAKVRFSSGTIVVDHDPGRATAAELVKTVRRLGYAAEVAPF